MTPILLEDVTLSHRGLPVLRSTSASVASGETVILTGETGAGKTSLLRLLYGDLPPDAGRVIVAGVALSGSRSRGLPKLRRRMGLIFQDDKLLDDRSVYENIRFALSIQSSSSEEVTRRALELLAGFGLSHLRSQMPAQLSAGESQRVGIARALANDPSIILADEPTGDLDAATASQIFNHLAAHRHAATIIIATHDPDRAMEAFPTARHWHLAHGAITEDGAQMGGLRFSARA